MTSGIFLVFDFVFTRKTLDDFYNPLRFPRFPGDRNPAGATRSKRLDNDKPKLPRGEVLSL